HRVERRKRREQAVFLRDGDYLRLQIGIGLIGGPVEKIGDLGAGPDAVDARMVGRRAGGVELHQHRLRLAARSPANANNGGRIKRAAEAAGDGDGPTDVKIRRLVRIYVADVHAAEVNRNIG